MLDYTYENITSQVEVDVWNIYLQHLIFNLNGIWTFYGYNDVKYKGERKNWHSIANWIELSLQFSKIQYHQTHYNIMKF